MNKKQIKINTSLTKSNREKKNKIKNRKYSKTKKNNQNPTHFIAPFP